jgi:hypothetical protein
MVITYENKNTNEIICGNFYQSDNIVGLVTKRNCPIYAAALRFRCSGITNGPLTL